MVIHKFFRPIIEIPLYISSSIFPKPSIVEIKKREVRIEKRKFHLITANGRAKINISGFGQFAKRIEATSLFNPMVYIILILL